jgi:hypothetical protein
MPSPTVRSIAAYWAGFGPLGQYTGMFGSFQTCQERIGSWGSSGCSRQNAPAGP